MLQIAEKLDQRPGDWSGHANKGYVGRIKGVIAPSGETWTPEYYIDQYLESRGRPVTQWNRTVVATALGKYTGPAPYAGHALDEHLDSTWKLA